MKRTSTLNINYYVTKEFFLHNSKIIITQKNNKIFFLSEKYEKEKLQFMRRLKDGKLAVGYHHQIGS